MIEVSNLSKTFGKENPVHAVVDFTHTFQRGNSYAICGPSGCGKSTLLRMLGLISTPTTGTINIDGHNVADIKESDRARLRSTAITMIFQEFALLEEDTAIQNVTLPLEIRKEGNKRTRREKAMHALERVGLSALATKKCEVLSGGEKQRVAIARALVMNCPYLLADEPTGALDTENSHHVIDLFTSLTHDDKAVIVVTHDPLIAEKCDHLITMKDGHIHQPHTPST